MRTAESSDKFYGLLGEVCSIELSPEERRSRFAALLETPGGPFKDSAKPMIDSVLSLAEVVTKRELRRRSLSPEYLAPEDVAHETLMILLQRCHKIQDRSKIRSWLWGVMRWKASKLLRKSRNLVEVTDLDIVEYERRVAREAHASERQNNASHPRALAVRASLRKLSPALRRVVMLHVLRGYSLQETAEALRITANAARVRWLRAKRALEAELAVLTKAG